MSAFDDPSDRQDLWAPRRRLTLGQARRRSDVVALLRLAFISGAAISIGLLMGYIVAQGALSAAGSGEVGYQGEAVRMLNPRFSGRDAAGDPYQIEAESALRRREAGEVIDLAAPKLRNAEMSEVVSASGVLDRREGVLRLMENVTLTRTDGSVFRAESAVYDLSRKRVAGEAPIEGETDFGQIRADRFELRGPEREVVLSGDVWTRIFPDGEEASKPMDDGPSRERSGRDDRVWRPGRGPQ